MSTYVKKMSFDEKTVQKVLKETNFKTTNKKNCVTKFRFPKTREFIRTKIMANENDNPYILAFLRNDCPPYQILPVQQDIYEELSDKCFLAKIYLTVNLQQNVFIWPVKINYQGAAFYNDFASRAETEWVAYIQGNKIIEPKNENKIKPKWPRLDPRAILEESLEKLTADKEDPIIRNWLGII
jgi:hypothetical protein